MNNDQRSFILGTKKRKRYFEGWYFKGISVDRLRSNY